MFLRVALVVPYSDSHAVYKFAMVSPYLGNELVGRQVDPVLAPTTAAIPRQFYDLPGVLELDSHLDGIDQIPRTDAYRGNATLI